MPLKKCSANGKSGWKWGDQGHCYTGPSGKKQAIKQGVAIEGPEKFASMAQDFEESVDVDEFTDVLVEEGRGPVEVALAVANFTNEVALAYIPKAERDKIPTSDFGDPKNRKFPIRNQDDLNSAVKLIGKAANPAAVKKRIISIAKRKGLTLPDSWK